jgi:hypothetical protein
VRVKVPQVRDGQTRRRLSSLLQVRPPEAGDQPILGLTVVDAGWRRVLLGGLDVEPFLVHPVPGGVLHEKRDIVLDRRVSERPSDLGHHVGDVLAPAVHPPV